MGYDRLVDKMAVLVELLEADKNGHLEVVPDLKRKHWSYCIIDCCL
jgi:hypothetical protein